MGYMPRKFSRRLSLQRMHGSAMLKPRQAHHPVIPK